MPKLILKSPYLKPGEKAHIARYIKYIATRENVELSENTDKYKPATKKQQELIQNLLADYPDISKSFEYEDYCKKTNIGNAHEIINYGVENYVAPDNKDKGDYVKYIAFRPRVQKLGAHGLFTDSGVPFELDDVCEEVSESGSNIWTHIISLKREDAERLGYDNADAWVQLLRAHRDDIAKAMHISPKNFRWYAAFHNEAHHPHVHVVAYSVKPGEAFLNTNGIEKIKSTLANDIFRDEMNMVYQQKDKARQNIKSHSELTFMRILSSVGTDTYINPELENELLKISDSLKRVKGKKQYGYLPPNIKKMIDNVVDMLSADPRIKELYDLWYTQKIKTFDLYTDKLPEKIPLSKNKEFKSIKNMIINRILNMENVFKAPEYDDRPRRKRSFGGDYKIGKAYYDKGDIPAAIEYFEKAADKDNQYAQYNLGKIYLTEEGHTDVEKAISLFSQSAENGNDNALYQLGKAYYDKGDIPAAIEYFEKAADKDNQYAQYNLGKIYLTEDGHTDVEKAISLFSRSAENGNDNALYPLGKAYYDKGDIPAAIKYFEKAADKENQYAQYSLGRIYLTEEGYTDVERAISLFSRSAENGNENALYPLGKAYYDKGDIPAAIEYFEKAADKDNQYAQYSLGKIYLTEEGYRNAEKAISLFSHLATKGDDNAFYQLGKIYLSEERYINVPKAVFFFSQSAASGNDYALYQLGKIFYFGTGDIEKNEGLALKFLNDAAQRGNQYAAEMLQSIADNRNVIVSMCSLSLLKSVAGFIGDKVQPPPAQTARFDRFLDRRELAKMNEKKQAQGLKD